MKSLRVSLRNVSIAAAAAWLAGCGQAGGSIPQARTNVRAQDATPLRPATSSYRVVYRFDRHPNGDKPFDGLLSVNGTLFGTASGGGLSCHFKAGCGTLFSISPKGAEKLIFSFDHTSGNVPVSGLIEMKGVLYGTTVHGGIRKQGTVYSITPSGSETVLHSFESGADGAEPRTRLTDVNGTLYGTTLYGGAGRYPRDGVIFSISSAGAFNVLYRFKGGTDGARPSSRMINVDGRLYGTTGFGGDKSCANYKYYGCGTVYSITKSGVEKILHSFAGGSDGAFPVGSLLDVNGILYGTTDSGGEHNQGTVYTITTSGTEKVLYSFSGGSDGADPIAGLINVNGTLYGTTAQGGGGSCQRSGTPGCGTVYQISTSGAESVLYSFAGGTDGMFPRAPLVYVKGALYGTTVGGGSPGHKPADCCGTVFALTP